MQLVISHALQCDIVQQKDERYCYTVHHLVGIKEIKIENREQHNQVSSNQILCFFFFFILVCTFFGWVLTCSVETSITVNMHSLLKIEINYKKCQFYYFCRFFSIIVGAEYGMHSMWYFLFNWGISILDLNKIIHCEMN